MAPHFHQEQDTVADNCESRRKETDIAVYSYRWYVFRMNIAPTKRADFLPLSAPVPPRMLPTFAPTDAAAESTGVPPRNPSEPDRSETPTATVTDMVETASLVIVPTYNESDNIRVVIDRVMQLDADLSILIVDDGSPDGTAEIVRSAMDDYPGRVHLIEREGKLGLGTAYLRGFRFALEHSYTFICEMDADLSHDPDDLPHLIAPVKSGSATSQLDRAMSAACASSTGRSRASC